MFLVPSLWPKQFFHIWLNGNKDRLWWLAVSWERWVNFIAIRVDIFQQAEYRERQILSHVVTCILGKIGKFCLLGPPSIQNIQWVFQTVKCSECWLLWQSCEHNIRWINKNNNFCLISQEFLIQWCIVPQNMPCRYSLDLNLFWCNLNFANVGKCNKRNVDAVFRL